MYNADILNQCGSYTRITFLTVSAHEATYIRETGVMLFMVPDLNFWKVLRGSSQNSVSKLSHMECMLPVVVGQRAIVLSHGQREPQQLGWVKPGHVCYISQHHREDVGLGEVGDCLCV